MDSSLLTYTNSRIGININYPASWSQSEIGNGNSIVFRPPQRDQSDTIYFNIIYILGANMSILVNSNINIQNLIYDLKQTFDKGNAPQHNIQPH